MNSNMKYLIVLHKLPGDEEYHYSIVDSEILKNIKKDLIYKKKKVEDILYTKEELEALRNSLI